MTSKTWNRREFIAALAVGATASAYGDSTGPNDQLDRATFRARPRPPTIALPPGLHPLDLGGERDGAIYVPASYTRENATPLLVLLHGAGRSSTEWTEGAALQLADTRGVILLMPDSRAATWDRIATGKFGDDVAFIDEALEWTFGVCNIDAARIGLGGFSDGAGYALSTWCRQWEPAVSAYRVLPRILSSPRPEWHAAHLRQPRNGRPCPPVPVHARHHRAAVAA